MIISVIIPTRNRAPQLKRALDHLLQDDFSNKEIVVCDGASSDQTVELLQSYGERVRWMSEPDRGEYDARNKCLRLCQGDIIKYMSDDDVLLPGTFAYAAQYFCDHPEVDLLFGQSIWFDERGGRKPVVCDTRIRGVESITLRNFIRSSAPQVNSETAFFRRRVVDQIGVFDIAFHGADYDYWARAAKMRLRLDISDRVFLHYHLSDLSGVELKHTKLVFERWQRACQYGDWSDRLYVAFLLIPSRLAFHELTRYFPIVGLPLRDAWARLKTRNHALWQ